MCDYSLHLVASRPAAVGDTLDQRPIFSDRSPAASPPRRSRYRRLPAPGTELAFDDNVTYDRAFSLFGKARIAHKVARFRQINMDDPNVHHDALEFPGGLIVLVTRLTPGQRATVLQMPATARTHDQDALGANA